MSIYKTSKSHSEKIFYYSFHHIVIIKQSSCDFVVVIINNIIKLPLKSWGPALFFMKSCSAVWDEDRNTIGFLGTQAGVSCTLQIPHTWYLQVQSEMISVQRRSEISKHPKVPKWAKFYLHFWKGSQAGEGRGQPEFFSTVFLSLHSQSVLNLKSFYPMWERCLEQLVVLLLQSLCGCKANAGESCLYAFSSSLRSSSAWVFNWLRINMIDMKVMRNS
jgi:hypothetical protein